MSGSATSVRSTLPNRFMDADHRVPGGPGTALVAYLRNFRTEVMAKTGDADKRMLIVEYGLKVRQQKAHGRDPRPDLEHLRGRRTSGLPVFTCEKSLILIP